MNDRSFLYGDGLFETVHVNQSGAVRLDAHIARFCSSAEVFGFTDDMTTKGIEALESLRDQEPGLWRVTVSRDTIDYPYGGKPGIQIHRRELPGLSDVSVMAAPGFYDPESWIREHKTCSYLWSVEARRRAQLAGFDDALVCDGSGRVGEGTTSNLFVWVDDRVVTPSVQGILPGVTRAALMDLLGDVEETVVTIPMLKRAMAIVLTSSAGIRCCHTFEHRPLRAKPVQEWQSELFGV